LLAVVALIAVVARINGAELKVNGIPLGLWIAKTNDRAVELPLARVGTNAIPQLIELLRRQRAQTANRFEAWVWDHLPRPLQARFWNWRPVSGWQVRRNILWGLKSFGPDAKAALPEIVRVGTSDTNHMSRAVALVAALTIAPDSAEAFGFWKAEWERPSYISRRDLAIYLAGIQKPVPAAVPLLLKEMAANSQGLTTYFEAFEFFGDAATPAIPAMIDAFRKDPSHRGNLLPVFKRLGPVAAKATPVIAETLTNRNPDFVATSLEVLTAIGPAAQPAIPTIQPLLTNSDSDIQMLAAVALGRIEGKPEIALPILIGGLEGRLNGKPRASVKWDSRYDRHNTVVSGPSVAAMYLGQLGPAAVEALPNLEAMLTNRSIYIQIIAAQAVWRISGAKSKALPTLLSVIEAEARSRAAGEDMGSIFAVEAIKEMGPAASEAIPVLEPLRFQTIELAHLIPETLRSLRGQDHAAAGL